jgi:hypothetical protein
VTIFQFVASGTAVAMAIAARAPFRIDAFGLQRR